MWKSHLRWALLFYRAILNKMTSIKNEAGNLLPQAFVFNASNQQVRTVLLDGKPYFVAKDVCSILGISNHNDAVSRLDEDERDGVGITDPIGREQKATVVNESGLYHLIFQSRKPEAKAFRKWVTSEVLPTLRRTGRYDRRLPAIRYPRRGELVNAEVLRLLWLIGESLEQGDQKRIALELGVSRQTVNRVLNGSQRNSRVLMALYNRAKEVRDENALYYAPATMASRLTDYTCALPPLHCGGRGAAHGNTNARKSRSNNR